IHRVTLTALRPASAYVRVPLYHCGSEASWSDVFSFTALNESASWSPRFSIYGYMGNENPHIYDLILSAYAGNSRIGDELMRQIQSIAVYVPYMTCPGNHEAEANRLGNQAEWIITMGGNRSMYCSNNNKDDTCYLSVCLSALSQVRLGRNDTKPPAPGLEDVLCLHRLDLELWPKAPVHVITGSTVTAISVGAISNPRDCSAFCSTDYGYTCMQQVSDDQYGKVIDSIWMVKEKHGFSAWF
uniref:Uncharacterized protein n=1 Tax=Oncorhynchus mykiss TaxID=8022 RepID=A0A8C7SN03_ONCMY